MAAFMNLLNQKASKEGVEIETLKTFLRNEEKVFNDLLIDYKKSEPTDIRYDGTNYQITIGDKEQVQKRREINSREPNTPHTIIRNVFNISGLLLSGTLEKKVTRADKNTVLLIEVSSTGNRGWTDLKTEINKWVLDNLVLCSVWKEIYLVFNNKNIKVN